MIRKSFDAQHAMMQRNNIIKVALFAFLLLCEKGQTVSN